MRLDHIPHPVRSIRSMLVVACLAATALVCGELAVQVASARRALRKSATQTLHEYEGYVGRMVGTELFRRAQQTRDSLFAHVAADRRDGAVTLDEFVRAAAVMFARDGYAADPRRGYLRMDLETRTWEGAGALRDSARALPWVDTIGRMRRSPRLLPATGVLVRSDSDATLSAWFAVVRDQRTGHLLAYAVVHDRAVPFHHVLDAVVRESPLLPPSLTGSAWNIDAPSAERLRVANDSLLAIRVVSATGRELYRSPRWFQGAHQASYTFQTGPGGFRIETALRPGLERELVPAVLEDSSWTIYAGLALLGASLLTISLVAFWGEMQHREAARVRGLQHLVTGLRHELNNALATVLLEAQLLETASDVAPAVRDSASVIAEQAERMRDVIRRLDNVDCLPVVDYVAGTSMVDLTATLSHPVPTAAGTGAGERPDNEPRAA